MNKKTESYRFDNKVFIILIALTVFFGYFPLHAQRSPIDINLIIDGSASLTNVKNDVTSWVIARLDQILVDGDRVTVWNAGLTSKIVYAGTMSAASDRDAAKKSIRDFAPAGKTADFSGALRDAASRQKAPYSYTLVISASADALTSTLSGSQANLLRFSRVEEFSDWRVLVVNLNNDAKVKNAASAFFRN